MGGPGALVILGRAEPDYHIKIEHVLETNHLDPISNRLPAGQTYPNVWIYNTRPIVGFYDGGTFEISWISGELYPGEDTDFPSWRDDVSRYFGLHPYSRISLYAGVNQMEDHRILAELALDLARTFRGVIDFNGALLPTDFDRAIKPYINRAIAKNIKGWLDIDEHANWADVSEATRILLIVMPGRILEIPYQTGPDRIWVKHICDTEFMAAWLNHPDFHMIK